MSRSNELLEMEQEWLRRYIPRLISRASGWLRRISSAEARANTQHLSTEEVDFCRKLLEEKIVMPEDRVQLLEILIGERRVLLANTDPEVQTLREAEVTLINYFLRHLAEVDWEGLGLPDRPYDSTAHWGGFRLTEASMQAALYYGGKKAYFAGKYNAIKPGSEISLKEEPGTRSLYRLRITRIHAAEIIGERGSASIFEAVVTLAPQGEPKDHAFGILYANGQVLWMNSSPDSHNVDRKIQATLRQWKNQ